MGVGQAKETIAHVNRTFMEAFSRRDAASIAALYATHAQVLPPHSDIVTGKDAIQAFWQSIIDLGIRATIETIDLDESGSMAIEVGRYALALPDGAMADRGKYLVVWKQEAGEWRLFRDMWNSTEPAPPRS
jgi:uncharacterized protein (TIGR02246 family)